MGHLGEATPALLLVILAMGGVVALIYRDDHQEMDSQSSTIQQQSESLQGRSSAMQGQSSTIESQSLALQGDQ